MSAPPPVGIPIVQAVVVPEVLITAESQPEASEAHLANVDAEAEAVQAAFGGPANAEVHRNISVADLGRLLEGRKVWCFPGHGDAMLQSETVLAFVSAAGAVEVVSIDTLVSTVRPQVLKGKLELIVLTGCCTARLAAALRDGAFVPYIVCWETVLHDEAGRIFGTSFAKAIAARVEPPDAFEKARTEVCTVTERGKLDTGFSADVQKFELDVNPKDSSFVDQATGRLIVHPGASRGRLSAGIPTLLRYESTNVHDVPTLPAYYMPRPEQWDLRASLVNGVRGDGTVVGIVGANAVTGIAGTAGLGKTTTANWLALDPIVRSAFRDGVFWLEFGKERTAMQRLMRLAELLGVLPEDLNRLEGLGVDAVRDEVAKQLKGRCCLIILDDVWDKQQPKPFQKLACGRVSVLMTTRKSFIVEAFGEQLSRLSLRPMEDDVSTRLMVQSSGKEIVELHGPSLAKLVKMCAGVPAMLRSVGRMCHKRSAEVVVTWFADHKLSHRMPKSMASADGYQQDAADGNLFLAYEGQLEGLAERDEELATRCTMLSIFPEDTNMPLEILADLWGTDVAETREVVERLGGEHLVELVDDGAMIRLLDPVRDYLNCRAKGSVATWHHRLLEGISDGPLCQLTIGHDGEFANEQYGGYWDGDEGLNHFLHHALRSTTSLSCTELALGGSCAYVLQAVFRLMPHLRELHLESYRMGDTGIATFADVLCDGILSELQTLDMGDACSPSGQSGVSLNYLRPLAAVIQEGMLPALNTILTDGQMDADARLLEVCEGRGIFVRDAL